MDTKFNCLTLRICSFVLLIIGAICDLDSMEPGQCLSKFDYDYRVLQKLVFLESKLQAIEDRQRSTQNILEEEKQKREYISDQIVALNETVTLYTGGRVLHAYLVNCNSKLNTTARSVYAFFIKAKQGRTACRDGWLAYNGSCYYFGRENTNFENAKALCAQLDSYLVQVETETENEFVRHFLKSFISKNGNINFWLGITDSQEEGIWRWNSDGSVATFKGWVGTEPQDYGSGEDCAMFSSGLDFGWADLPCTSSIRPLCEEKL